MATGQTTIEAGPKLRSGRAGFAEGQGPRVRPFRVVKGLARPTAVEYHQRHQRFRRDWSAAGNVEPPPAYPKASPW